MSELERWREAVTEVTAQLRQYPGRSDNDWLRNFPHGSCSVTSYAVGRLLLERYGEQWLLVSRSGYGTSTHTWLVRDAGEGQEAAIDATLHQFTDLAREPFIGWGASPADEYFPDFMGSPVYVGLVDDSWHHGATDEIYEWLFPRLGLSKFNRAESLRHLMPEDLANPPVCRLIDEMVEASARSHQPVEYAIALNPTTAAVLCRNSDAALRRHEMKSDEYLGRIVLSLEQVDGDVALLIPLQDEEVSADAPCLIGLVSSGRFCAIQMHERERFDVSSLSDKPATS
ncbi:hypothetical protein SAMN04487846_3565 [Microbacterium sp. cf046]|uniref:hypothetical protein n=1 Tax=Microbacterium sp. cf046 TaxID=1761803 RepID=UPI0008F3CEA2|nr:hypothetical protein [Microbacterium sp. cf046]SFS17467.1 hypothetical protein SAMN04487846_3565 [Microbacterium sp. cf046]